MAWATPNFNTLGIRKMPGKAQVAGYTNYPDFYVVHTDFEVGVAAPGAAELATNWYSPEFVPQEDCIIHGLYGFISGWVYEDASSAEAEMWAAVMVNEFPINRIHIRPYNYLHTDTGYSRLSYTSRCDVSNVGVPLEEGASLRVKYEGSLFTVNAVGTFNSIWAIHILNKR